MRGGLDLQLEMLHLLISMKQGKDLSVDCES
jgi:hypothetical protein